MSTASIPKPSPISGRVGAILLQDAPEHYSRTLRAFDRDPDRDERAQHLADKFYVQEVLQRDS
ncbi:hypothetical protein ELI41_20485 [Rhizobium leguminosarum]|nr:hypothetical protein ELI41_20485 [Rhizobium leguminosarum]TAV56284.1 hypothetical protein ELI29_21225 [Rhizobium leguminosarum]TAV92275.1 hypothetical protein ELI22_20440 [Rhizobium leguminosarum]TAV96889.1 hypothetical protein ELI21_20600 [Rhizobium leguminosarum]TAW37965.1 hypothetical protein ELI23_20645 [Rhizobium leguminosarum]